jgi:MFS family permease
MLQLNRYQWTVLFAAWLGWGFDIFDGLLFNYVAPNCIPTLLGIHLPIDPQNTQLILQARQQTIYWNGLITSILLIGWAVGGVIFGYICDRIGRTKTLLITMLFYAIGTFCCAFAPNIEVLLLCRLVASLGIGGEWAAGAAMVAEVVPEKSRVEAGALLYTSAPMGLFLASFVNDRIARVAMPGSPDVSWRYVFLCGLIPAVVAFIMRAFIKEPEAWESEAAKGNPPQIGELFSPEHRRTTLSGFLVAVIALLTWWTCNAFIPTIATELAKLAIKTQGTTDRTLMQVTIETWKTAITYAFNAGGLIGTLLTIPAAKYLGRKWMFGIYFALSSASLILAFGSKVPAELQLWSWLYFAIGLTVFGIFGAFTYYLPELFPTRLRGTGSGFCYNAGRLITAIGPFVLGTISSKSDNPLQTAIQLLFIVGFIPLIGIAIMPLVIETKNRKLS